MARFPLLLLVGETSKGKVDLNQYRMIYMETEDTRGRGDPPTESQGSKRTALLSQLLMVWQSPVLVPDLVSGLCLKGQLQGGRVTYVESVGL